MSDSNGGAQPPHPRKIDGIEKVVSSPQPAAEKKRSGIRPRPKSEAELGWTRQKMVRWMDPGQLSDTAVRAVLSDLFGSYADKREVQAALHASEITDQGPADPDLFCDFSNTAPGDPFWLDYVADLGDGFDSSYTLPWFLGAAAVRLEGEAEAGAKGRASRAAPGAGDLPRGSILVMGGDQVYPTASRQEYANRLAGPFEAALPGVEDEAKAPRLFAVPGNHDWYDGLTAFSRLFGQGRWIGGWRTEQKRSYFAAKLPKGWWLLGIDVQLHSDIDKPQLDYFCRLAQEHMQAGEKVILCTAEPAWVYTKKHADAFDNLAYFESQIRKIKNVEFALTLTGDLHHYSRYQNAPKGRAAPKHKITAGGGGAYLLGTGWLDEGIVLKKEPNSGHAPGERDDYVLTESYPDKKQSKMLRLGAIRLPFFNPTFAAFLGGAYAVFAWMLQAASLTRTYELDQKLNQLNAQDGDPTTVQLLGTLQSTSGNFVQKLADTEFSWRGFLDLGGYFANVVAHAPALALLSVLFVVGTFVYCDPDPGTPKWLKTPLKYVVGPVHGALHLLAILLFMWGSAHAATALGVPPGGTLTAAVLVAMFAVGGGIAASLFSLFLLPGLNYNDAFSAQHLGSYKNFLRMRIDRATGELTVYPFGIDRQGKWTFDAKPDTDATRAQPYFVPASESGEPVAHLLEAPFSIAAPAQAAAAKAAESASARAAEHVTVAD
jgi:hypothetical protein